MKTARSYRSCAKCLPLVFGESGEQSEMSCYDKRMMNEYTAQVHINTIHIRALIQVMYS